MGIFSFNFGKKSAAPAKTVSVTASSSSAPAPSQDQTTTAPRPQQTVQVISEPVKPAQPHTEQKPPEMWRFLMLLSSTDAAKVEQFTKEMIRKITYEWHAVPGGDTRIKGRVGMAADGKKLRIELKGYHEDVENLLKWVKIDHFGVHATYVEKYVIGSMPYSGLFQKKTGSW